MNSDVIIHENKLTKEKKKMRNFIRIIIAFSSILLLLLICTLCEVIPRYINLPISPPNNNEIAWDSIEYSVRVIPVFPLMERRMFVSRKEFLLTNGNFSWDKIVNYFDKALYKFGWIKTNSYSPCVDYFPEEKFIPHNNENEKGYVFYRPQKFDPINDYNAGDSICIAIWKEIDSTTNSYHIVLYGVRASILSWFFLTN